MAGRRDHLALDEGVPSFPVLFAALQPELNMIEILWKQAKYHWREFVTWSKESFRSQISKILDGFGTEFQINFA